MESFGLGACQLPPGFRFHPTDQELIIHYLRKKATSSLTTPTTTSIIADIDLYKYNPWDLPEKSLIFGEGEWFFFSPRDRKYPNGARPNRAAASGYWKATGTDKPILASGGSKCLGVKKALVFYKGRPPKGIKTDWIMHEYRLTDTANSSQKHKGSMRLDDWVLCRVRQKGFTVPGAHELLSCEPIRTSAGYCQQVPQLVKPESKKLPAAAAAAAAAAAGIDTKNGSSSSSSSNLYEWSDSQLLSYLLSSQQEGGGESSTSSTIQHENSGSTTNSSYCLINNNNNIISFDQGYAAAAADHIQLLPLPVVSSVLDSIKRKLSFGALDELMLQPPTKKLHCYIGDDQLMSPTSSFSVDQTFSGF